MEAEEIELSFLLADTSCMYSWFFDNMEADEADKLLMILEKQIAKDYSKYIQVRILTAFGRDIESVMINPKGQIKVQLDRWKILSKALKELSK